MANTKDLLGIQGTNDVLDAASGKDRAAEALMGVIGVKSTSKTKAIARALEPAFEGFDNVVTGVFTDKVPELKSTLADIEALNQHKARIQTLERMFGVR